MLTVQQAQEQLAQRDCVKPSERIQLKNALGRVASKDIVSSINVPPQDNSAMDGFAVKAADLIKGKEELLISQRIPAGAQPLRLEPSTAARIFTGGVIPQGADAVVIQENCEFDDQRVCVLSKVRPSDNIRKKGQDITQGAVIVEKGRRLNAVDLGLIASVGHVEVAVFEQLKAAVFSTGDELIEPGQPLEVGQIYNSNRTMLLALCEQLGYQVIDCGIVEDSLEATKAALLTAASDADVIISSGGVSVGEEDHVKPAVEALGELALWKVQMKPGKPVAYGHINGTPFLGLPGNPVSSYIVFQLLGLPLLRSVQGQTKSNSMVFQVRSDFDKVEVTREEYIRVKLVVANDGQIQVERFKNLSSGVLSSLAWADGLVRQTIGGDVQKGQMVEFFPFREGLL